LTVRKLATLLTDFDARPDEPGRACGAPLQDASFYPTLADGPGGALSVARCEGYEAGLAKARAQATVESEAAGRRASAERAHWVESESRQLAVKFEAAFAAIAAAVCDQLAVTLRPVVFDAVVRRARSARSSQTERPLSSKYADRKTSSPRFAKNCRTARRGSNFCKARAPTLSLCSTRPGSKRASRLGVPGCRPKRSER
jgi:hypothetical protein